MKSSVFIRSFTKALHQLNMFGGMDVSKLFMERSTNKLEMFQLKSHTDYGKLNGCHWWNDPVLIVGSITAQERHICVRNRSNGKDNGTHSDLNKLF